MAKSNPNYLEFFKILVETVTVGATAVEPHRFINRSGIYPATAGAYAAGVTNQAAAAGLPVAITTIGIDVVEVGAAIAAIDTPLFADAAGKVRPVTDGATQKTVGYALDTATGTGVEFIRVKLA